MFQGEKKKSRYQILREVKKNCNYQSPREALTSAMHFVLHNQFWKHLACISRFLRAILNL